MLQLTDWTVPPLALRSDPTAILTLLPHLGKLIKGLPVVGKVEGSFKDISKKVGRPLLFIFAIIRNKNDS